MSEATKSYRSVSMCPTDSMRAACSFVDREWGSYGYQLGFVAPWVLEDSGRIAYVFQVKASDGSLFLVWADRWENVGQFDDEGAVALALDVEVSS